MNMEAPRVPATDRMRFRARAHTRWSDEDNQGVLNNAVYLTLFEEARHAYFGSLGLLAENRFPFLLAHCNVQFLAPGRGGVDVEIDVATTRLGVTSFEQAYRVRHGDEVWCEAVARLVCVDARTQAKVPIAAAFRAALVAREGDELMR